MFRNVIAIFIALLSLQSFAGTTSYRKLVSATIKTKVPIFRKCYQKALDENGHIRGKTINFIIKIDPQGYLSQIHVANSYHMGVLRCVNSNLAGLRFSPPPNKKPFVLKVPMRFKINYY